MTGQRSAGASVPALLLSTEKVTASHRSRDAYVYVRQSTPSQMIHHTESLARQYELRERAVMLGWPAHQVVVIDADLGRSGAQTAGRTGFKELVADVGLGKVGIVLGIEVSRLARNNADWYQLLDLCAITDTLIADADGVYHPADFNDRLVLGLKGTMSEAELHLIRSRLTAGLKHKAAKGELRQGLPVGLDYDEDDKVVLCADEAVREAITTVFRRFDELGSARQVLIRLREDGVLLPRRRNGCQADHLGPGHLSGGARLADQPGLCRGVRVRPHPHREAGRPGHRGRACSGSAGAARAVGGPDPRSPSRVHHLGDLRGQHRTAARQLAPPPRAGRRRGAGGPGAAAGPAALRAVRADHADRYSGTKGNCPRYVCARAKQLYAGEHVCQSIGGVRLENTVLDELFAVLEPAALTATAQALAEADTHHRRDLAVFELADRTGPLRSRPRAASVRQRRTGEPFGGKDIGNRVGNQAGRGPRRGEQPGRSTRPAPGGADRTGTGLDHHRRRRRAGGVRRPHHHAARTQTTHPRGDRRDRRHRATPSSASRSCGSSGRAAPAPRCRCR